MKSKHINIVAPIALFAHSTFYVLRPFKQHTRPLANLVYELC